MCESTNKRGANNNHGKVYIYSRYLSATKYTSTLELFKSILFGARVCVLIPAILVRCAFDSIRGTVAPNIHLCVNILLYICITECSLAHSVYIADRLCFLPSSCLLPFAIFHFSFFSASFSLSLCVYVYVHCTPFPRLFRTCSFQNGSNAVCAIA